MSEKNVTPINIANYSDPQQRGIVKIVVTVIVVVILFGLIVLMAACSKVEPGYVGIVVDNYGSQRGVEDFPVRTGRVFVNPFTQNLYKFPTFQQTVTWTANEHEGKSHDESITFNAKGGTPINADISLSYGFIPEKVPALFVEFKQDADTIMHGYMRSRIREAFNNVAGHFDPIDIVANRKGDFLKEVKDLLDSELTERGIKIDYVTFVSSPRPPENVQNAINGVIEAQQKAQQAQAEVARVEAEGRKQVAAAEAQATATLTAARAESEANQLRQKSLTPLQLQHEWLEKWNGQLPQIQGGGATPFIQMPHQ